MPFREDFVGVEVGRVFCFLHFGFFAAALGGPGDSGRGRHLPTLMFPLQHMGGRVGHSVV